MKVIYKKIGLFTTLCYCFGIILIAYLLISIPQDLKNLTLGLSDNVLEQVNPMFNKLNVSIAVVLGLGMISLVLLLFNDKSASSNQQFFVAGKTKEKNKASAGQQVEENNEDEENDQIMQKIDQILTEKNDIKSTSNKILSAVCKEFEACQGAIYISCEEDDKRFIELISSFAYPIADSEKIKFEFGEGLVGQAAKEGKIIYIDSVPDGYIKILSGLGSSSPSNLIIVPFISKGSVRGVAEIASFKKFPKKEEETLSKIFSKMAPIFLAVPDQVFTKKKTTIVQ